MGKTTHIIKLKLGQRELRYKFDKKKKSCQPLNTKILEINKVIFFFGG